ncbi:MAG: LytTR family DNA-binding domain-containing protein [Gammaproteobacteria bacterium]|nr:LytTR family DNA-binding domain-containing protein [Gammaproteobacteria bacterium]MBU2056641.1 LytTR family DNA-binding domain-containing protein [Gammaproteobacteria bacterium]MBU2173978.1 LytTR family DNA-binding domain-containing protein [Gammaproteobacteria bacterium]MBU2247284.1 LytTR family DNA-binding domain-containing protein [Gammaproteobacteria bacterium]MBU2344942.1 LytTR family DNA-binding domain-containing protein [Gammaproteobacteria bacterium]
MTILNTLIVDDEPAAIEGLRLRLDAFPQIRVTGEANSVAEAIALINTQTPDLIFLDIEMPEQSGFDLIRQLQPELCPAIVFVTAFHQHAVKAFEVRALDYLLKPVKMERLAEAIARVCEVTSNRADKAQMLAAVAEITKEQLGGIAGGSAEPGKNENAVETVVENREAAEPQYCIERQKLVIQDGRNPIQLIPYQDIIWIDAAGDYMCVHTQAETYVMRARLKSLIDERLPDVFVRIHKSTVVNLTYIEKLQPLCNSEYNAVLQNEKVLKVSRTYARALKQRLLG